ncbi:apolipoprotein N-acyltransferase [Magnetospirillum sp. UT-4]|uniref:apolipoprotein N-acyltransferase n=1 Tax=Magnetospirillum sp. UT-4 TaxID=2681467 RepID=UPI00137DDADE|nr:apolipoprotein N-acyltransferase [Magnetospirillum sp. UT-4]CAA7624489.1 Apolipoprotein N-acyltransferase [Magnetospirillum sp. UT-4]
MTATAAVLALARAGGFAGGGLGALPGAVAGLKGWRRNGLLAALGLLSVLALPPVGLVPVLLPTVAALVWALGGATSRKGAFAVGWWWGLGWYAGGFYWIGNAMLIEPEKFAWMIPFSTLGLGGVQAVFLGLATLGAWMLRPGGVLGVVALAGTWTLAEWVRSWFLTGFPWNPLGSVWDAVPAVLQGAAVVGVYGLCLGTVLVFGLPAAAAQAPDRRVRMRALGAALALAALTLGGGGLRLAANPTETVDGIRLRLIQAAIGQQHKWQEDLREAHLLDQIELTRQPGLDGITHVVWPETAAPFFLDLDARHRALVAHVAPPGGMVLTGAPRITPKGVEPMRLWNSLMAIDGAGQVVGGYDKVHLVPFGEYVPLRQILPIAKITHGGTDFSPGPGLRTLDLPGLPPFSPLICYEAIFSGSVVGGDQQRPDWLLTVTNDGWFGLSAGPYQHLAAGRMRAVEEGLPLVRSANTGISGVWDPLGREVARLDLGRRGIVDSSLPRPLPATIYARLGPPLPLALALACLVVAGLVAGGLRRASRGKG